VKRVAFVASVAFAIYIGIGWGSQAQASITLNLFATGQTAAPIGFVYAGDKFVGSYYFSSSLYQVGTSGGSVTSFMTTPLINPAFGENPLGSSLGLGSFPNRDIYVGNYNNIVHVTNDGSSANVFVSGLSGNVKGITFDAVGTFGNDMIVTTDNGSVYRVDSSGTATLVGNVGSQVTEGADIAPSTFGAYAGQVVVASETANAIYAISNSGIVTQIPLVDGVGNPTTIPSAEQLSFVPLNLGVSGNSIEGYYATNYPNNVYKADASQFNGMLGDAIVSAEYGSNAPIWDVHFNGTQFVATQIGNLLNQAEDGLFVTADILNPGCSATGTCGNTVPEPATIALLGLGLAGIGFSRKRSR
jgi:hypothetical protein